MVYGLHGLLSFVHDFHQSPLPEFTDTRRVIFAIFVIEITAHDLTLFKRTLREEICEAPALIGHKNSTIDCDGSDSLPVFCIQAAALKLHDIFCVHFDYSNCDRMIAVIDFLYSMPAFTSTEIFSLSKINCGFNPQRLILSTSTTATLFI